MVPVTRAQFYAFIAENNLREVQGPWFHSSNFLDAEGKIMAYHESSSWGPQETFLIESDYCNLETTLFVNKLLNQKTNNGDNEDRRNSGD